MNKDMVPSIPGSRCQTTPTKEENVEESDNINEFIGDEELLELKQKFEMEHNVFTS